MMVRTASGAVRPRSVGRLTYRRARGIAGLKDGSTMRHMNLTRGLLVAAALAATVAVGATGCNREESKNNNGGKPATTQATGTGSVPQVGVPYVTRDQYKPVV